jgi:hypothetical protein
MTTRRPTKRRKFDQLLEEQVVPTFDASTEWSQALLAYRKSHVILLKDAWKGVGKSNGSISERTKSSVMKEQQEQVYSTLHNIAGHADVEKSWNLELAMKQTLSPQDILLPFPRVSSASSSKSALPRKWYASFILKTKELVEQVLPRLPIRELPNDSGTCLRHGKAVWCFIGRNGTRSGFKGRPEHTDSVRHDGTWHYQVTGIKTWHLRPTKKLIEKFPPSVPWRGKIDVHVKAGDVLLVDTAKWWHQTEIPCTLSASEQLSSSYARDIYIINDEDCDEDKKGERVAEDHCSDGDDDNDDDMTNVDWLYAPHDISKGEIVLTEDDVPDASFPESHEPNCDVMEDEETGKMVVVAIRDIESGEFFSIAIEEEDEEGEE